MSLWAEREAKRSKLMAFFRLRSPPFFCSRLSPTSDSLTRLHFVVLFLPGRNVKNKKKEKERERDRRKRQGYQASIDWPESLGSLPPRTGTDGCRQSGKKARKRRQKGETFVSEAEKKGWRSREGREGSCKRRGGEIDVQEGEEEEENHLGSIFLVESP